MQFSQNRLQRTHSRFIFHNIDFKATVQNITDQLADVESLPEVDLAAFRQTLPEPENISEIQNFPRGIVALTSFYTPEGNIDLPRMKNHINNLAEGGVRGFLLEGTTGEASSHSHEVQIQIINQLSSYIKNQLSEEYNEEFFILSGAGSNSSEEQEHLAKAVFESNSDAALLLPPYYIKSSAEGILRHLWDGLNQGPAIIYSISGRTGVQIPLEVLFELSQHPNFIGVKECDGQDRIKSLAKRNIQVWSGNDDQAAEDIKDFGAFGVISVTMGMNYLVERTRKNIMLAITEEDLTQEEVQNSMILAAICFPQGQPNPIAIRYVLEVLAAGKDELDENISTFISPVNGLLAELQPRIHQLLELVGLEAEPLGENFQNLRISPQIIES